jgi:hypothetical protein
MAEPIGQGVEPRERAGHAIGDRQPAESVLDRLAVRGIVLPEARIPGPDPLDCPLPIEPPESLPIGLFETLERELQATLIAFSFSASAFKRES